MSRFGVNGFNMSMREAKQRASVNGCYIRSNIDGSFRVGKYGWSEDERKYKEYTTDCLETAAIKSGALH